MQFSHCLQALSLNEFCRELIGRVLVKFAVKHGNWYNLSILDRKPQEANGIILFLQVDEDEPLFLSLISDLFPGITLDTVSYEDLQDAIEKHVPDMGIVNHPPWNLKVGFDMSSSYVRGNQLVLLVPLT